MCSGVTLLELVVKDLLFRLNDIVSIELLARIYVICLSF